MTDGKTATLFTNGGSQAVRLPKEFRLPGTVVSVRRLGRGVLLEPLEGRAWPVGYWERLTSLAPMPDDMVVPPPLPPSIDREARLAALESEGPDQAGAGTRRKRGGRAATRRRRKKG